MSRFELRRSAGAPAPLSALLLAALLAGCATDQPPMAAPAGSKTVDVQIQPARIPPNEQGAFALSTFTGCNIVFLGKAAGTDTFSYGVATTSRMATIDQCLASLRQQPGVLAVSAPR